MRAKIIEKEEIAKGTLLAKFNLLGKEVIFRPGQFFFITLINYFYNDEKGSQRHFSIVNSPNEKGLITMATRLRESAFKKSLFEAPLGAEVEIGDIAGDFILPDNKFQPIVFIAGGIGITPYISMLRYIQEEKIDYQITLIYSNRDTESTAFLEELKKIPENNQKFKLILTMTDDLNWSGEKRIINGQFIKEYTAEPEACFYMVSGPPRMVEAVYNALIEIGIEKKNIKTEDFSGY